MEIKELLLLSLSAFINNNDMPEIDMTDELFKKYIGKATSQKILPMTAYALLKSGNVRFSEEQRNILTKLSKQQIITQTLKSTHFLSVYTALRKAGTEPLCVKGIICRTFYPQPEYRPSGDEDIVVKEEDYEKCFKILKELNFTSDNEDLSKFETGFVNKDNLSRIELHKSFFDPTSNILNNMNNLLKDIFIDTEVITYQNIPLTAPEKNRHLLYIIFHAFKHFIYSGTGIRQILDIIVLSKSFSPDWNMIFSKCSKVKADSFLSAVLLIGNKYFGMDLKNVKDNTLLFDNYVDTDDLLTDIFDGSVYGADTIEKQHSAAITFDKVDTMSRGRNSTLLSSVLPSYTKMRKKYPFIDNKPYLLPLAWIKRFVDFSAEKNDKSEIISISKRRETLLKKYKVI